MGRLRRFIRDYVEKKLFCTLISGNGCGNLYFIWTVPEDEHESDLLTQSQAVVGKVGATVPTYHTRAMRKQFVHNFQLLVHIEPKIMREMYC